MPYPTLIKTGADLTDSEKSEIKDELEKAKQHLQSAINLIEKKGIESTTLITASAKTDIALKEILK